ncbi:hypothetical protein GH714_000933 [Hevea brasiliensis]|uniref:Uncharacterized protein n=1 Tax=Hevea brasiliensis TaxID=3981 RepID=A0A6A6NAT4_HEVBR|nr:hypothetical protein GH714_000933 [Hevea brasiliensis]
MKGPKPKEENPNNVVSARKPMSINGAIKTSRDSKDNAGDVQEPLVRKEAPRTSIEEIVEDYKLKRLKESFTRLPLVGKNSKNEKICQIYVILLKYSRHGRRSGGVVLDCNDLFSGKFIVEESKLNQASSAFCSSSRPARFKVRTFDLRGGAQVGDGSSDAGKSVDLGLIN